MSVLLPLILAVTLSAQAPAAEVRGKVVGAGQKPILYLIDGARLESERRTEKRELDLSLLSARGTDIGKPNSTASMSPTWYPRENQNLLQFRWNEKRVGAGGEILFHAFVNPNFLETQTDTYTAQKTTASFSRTQSTDFGSQLSYGKRFGASFRVEGGLDYFGRAGARSVNDYKAFDASGAVTAVQEKLPFTEGRRSDLGLFISADYAGVRRLDLLAGVRWDTLRMDAVPLGADTPLRARDNAGTGFLAASYKLTEELTGFVNAGRAYRLPSLSERFYTGISGRGFIIGQPGLKPETSLNLDGGLKLLESRFFARPDAEAMLEPARNLRLGIPYAF